MKDIGSNYPVRINNINKEELLGYFKNAWQLNDLLFKTVQEERHLYIAPDPLRFPLVFYLGHTAAFYINKLNHAKLINQRINPSFETIFEQGVDPATEHEMPKYPPSYWPKINDLWTYRANVFEFILQWVEQSEIEKAIDSHSPFWSFIMALEHDRIHFETSSMLIRQLSTKHLVKPKQWDYAPTLAQETTPQWVDIPPSIIQLGKRAQSLYGWDNEYGRLKVEVPAFRVGKNLVSNFEFRRFVEDFGYENKTFWSDEGWEWKKCSNTILPKFWLRDDRKFYYRAMFNNIEMPWDWPVEVNYFEAMAYCRWLGAKFRLMTEAEYMAVVDYLALEAPYEIGSNYNLNLCFGSPTPIGYFSNTSSKNTVNDMFGNVWQWLDNSFYPLPGFKPHAYYLNFSEPYFDKDHVMLRGGSWASTGTSASCDYRLWFRKHFFQHAGFRICTSI